MVKKSALTLMTAAILLGSSLVTNLSARDEADGRWFPDQLQEDVFVSGFTIGTNYEKSTFGFKPAQGQYHTYRIPALVVTPKGTLVAICEGRRDSCQDHGDVDLVTKRSLDGGKTWGKQRLIYEEGGNAKITIGNPTAVVDRDTGTIWLAFSRTIFTSANPAGEWVANLMTHSDDDGLTWSKPMDMAKLVKKSWRIGYPGPGTGIQLRYGKHKGRLLIPFKWLKDGKGAGAVFYSDDHGKTWKRGKGAGPNSSENAVVELMDNSILMVSRDYDKRLHKKVATSTDAGLTWTDFKKHPELFGSTSQISLMRYTDEKRHDRNRILFSCPTPQTLNENYVAGRENMVVSLSYDEGKTWPVSKWLHKGPSCYSSMVILPDGDIGILYEAGYRHFFERLVFARFSLEWLTDGKDIYKP